MTIQHAIEKAQSKGYPKCVLSFDDGMYPYAETLLDPTFWIALGFAEGWEDVDEYEPVDLDSKDAQDAMEHIEKETGLSVMAYPKNPLADITPQWVLMPNTWQAKMHGLITAILEEKTYAQYFETL